MIEDDPNDAEALVRTLRSGSFELTIERMEQLDDVRRALWEKPWDVVLSEHTLPEFRYTDVLALLKTHKGGTPLVVVSGPIGEDEVVDALRSGAASFVKKSSLPRLLPTIERVLENAALKREHEFAQERIQLVQTAIDSAHELIFVLQVANGIPTKVLYVNAAERITGYSSQELYAGGLLLLGGPDTDPAAISRLRSAMKRGEAATSELLMYHKDGSTSWVESEIHPLAPGSGQFVSVSRDITERKRLEAQMAFLATHDPLTGLANRVLLHEELEHELALARRTGLDVAVMLVDLDGFKSVNDTRGHALGDDVLRDFALRLRSCVREADTVARLGGDEFVVVMGGISGLGAVSYAAERILASMREPFMLGTEPCRLSVSIGIAMHPSDDATPGQLIKNADMAMYDVKTRGKNAYLFSRAPGSSLESLAN
jgi:diguanylate cyclase (GGDEF)-like protein/PAS domain S-box-containing protein